MTKSGIAREVSKLMADKKQAIMLVDKIFKLIKDSLKKDEKVMISGFGTFKIKNRREKNYYNPKTREKITLPPKKAVKFKASKNF